MLTRSLVLAALAFSSFSAHAALTTYDQWDATYPGIAGVKFNVQKTPPDLSRTLQGTIAMGAHAFKNGVYLPNDGVSTYNARSGMYEPFRANWSFDYAWDITKCIGCSVQLWVDVDPTAGVDLQQLFLVNPTAGTYAESWNMEMSFINGLLYDFDPYSPSSTVFSLRLIGGADSSILAQSDITVNVPEPGSMALLGLGLVGAGIAARRRRA